MKDSEKSQGEESEKRIAVTTSIPLQEWKKSTDNLYKPLSSYLSYRGVLNKEKFFDLYNLDPEDFKNKEGYEDEATKFLAKGLKGNNPEKLHEALSGYIEGRVWPKVYESFKESISLLKDNEFYTALWSSLPSEMLEILGDEEHLDLNEVRGQELKTKGEGIERSYNGERKRIIAGERGRKYFKEELEKRLESEGLEPNWYLGIVESEDDPIIDWVKHPYLYDPTKEKGEKEEIEIPRIESFPQFYSEIKEKMLEKE